MNKPMKVGLSFGLTSATLTTLGLIIGLDASTNSKIAVAAGVLTIAIADSFSDAMGVHVSKESEGNFNHKEVWKATIYTFLGKFVFALSFLLPILLLKGPWDILVAVIWGVVILVILNYQVAKFSRQKPWLVVIEHLTVAGIVLVLSRLAGLLINRLLT